VKILLTNSKGVLDATAQRLKFFTSRDARALPYWPSQVTYHEHPSLYFKVSLFFHLY